MPKLIVSISGTLYDHHGNLVRNYKPKPAHSWLAQFIHFLNMQMSQAATWITDITDTAYNIGPHALSFRVAADASDLTWGMLIGSGTDDVTIDDCVLQSPITTDLNVSAHTFFLSYPTGNTRRLAISRTFTNTSVSPMVIEEVALYTIHLSAEKYCLDRTLYSVSIPASSSLTLTYRIDVSV